MTGRTQWSGRRNSDKFKSGRSFKEAMVTATEKHENRRDHWVVNMDPADFEKNSLHVGGDGSQITYCRLKSKRSKGTGRNQK